MKDAKLFDNIKDTVILPVPVACPSCAHKGDKVVVMPSGPHRKAMCIKCGGYIKFLRASEGHRLRRPNEDRTGHREPIYVATSIASDVEVLGSAFDMQSLKRQLGNYRESYRVDWIPGALNDAMPRTKVIAGVGR